MEEATTGFHPENTKLVIDPDMDGNSAVTLEGGDLSVKTESSETRETHASAVYDAVTAGHTPEEVSAEVAEPVAPESQPSPARTEPVPDPVWVIFEIEGFGEHRAPYHAVIRNGSNLVLVYDTAIPGGQRFFPRATEHPVGIRVGNSNTALMGHTTGIEFMDGSREYCVMLVEQEIEIENE
jgi:hypothetical protein